ncbi:MAG: FHA domain-containing protein [Abitibacteriaceae bacterium]|nr:FHA domain-containing protein [Abditibacteriaceae bacterium]
MRILYFYRGEQQVFDCDTTQVVIGRPRMGATPVPDLDLTPDLTVSRPHARIWREGSDYWIEDLGSTHGTQINNSEIKGKGAQPLYAGFLITIGETTLQVAGLPPAPPHSEADDRHSNLTSYAPDVAVTALPTEPQGQIAEALVAGNPDAAFIEATATDAGATTAGQRLSLLYEVLLKCGTLNDLDDLLQTIVERLVEAIPDATRGALLLRGGENDALLLKAFRSGEGPVVSETLARRAIRERIGFIWRRSEQPQEEPVGGSILQYRIESGMYAPLLWRDVALGVLCVDNPQSSTVFNENDLRLLLTVANYVAMVLANQKLQEDLRRESALKANLLRQFSPSVAEQLLSYGSLQLSGERSEVTILVSDIRGFTNLSRNMEPIEVVELLNEYFGRLIPIVFAHSGTVDKYIGDAILAVFGSPKKDPQQHENAVRAALDMQAAMEKLNAERAAQGKATCQIGIGIHSGEVLHGFIGVLDRMELTVIGEAVNRATRYSDGALAGEVLISPQVYQWVWKIVEAINKTIEAKHEGTLPAFRVTAIQDFETVQ